ncbi:MAG: MFS transporter [Pseudomonadales bacterium]
MLTQPSARIPAGIWALGLVSLFMDVSSEMIHALLPVFLVTVLGASTVVVGLIEGIGEATASISKLFSGWLSDRLGRRKPLIVAGYALGALSKPLFALAPAASWVLFARFTDRVGKGVRGAPRDALIGDLAEPGITGAAYGLRQSLDTVGAFVGPLLAIVLMAAFAGDFRAVFWIAVIPGLIAVAILVFGVHEPERRAPVADADPAIRITDVGRLGAPFWSVVGIGAALTLARFSEAFLVLRASDAGLAVALVPLVLVIMNAVYAVAAYPVGVFSDRFGRRALLMTGFLVLILADLVLAAAPGLWAVLIGVGLWGLHMGMTQGLLAALVADAAPAALRGSAFGIFHLATGIATLLASVIAGALWAWIGPTGTFLGGALFTLLGLAGMAAVSRSPSP